MLGAYLERSNEIQESGNKVLAKLSDAIVSIQIVMAEMKQAIGHSNEKIEKSHEKIKGLETSFDGFQENVSNKMNEIDDRGKFDVMNFITEKVIPFLLGGGAFYAITEAVKAFMASGQ